MDSGAITTTQANDLMLCPLSLGNPRTMTWDSGWTAESPSPDSSSNLKLASNPVNSAGSNACGGDLNNSTAWRVRVGAYKANAAAAAPPARRPPVVWQ